MWGCRVAPCGCRQRAFITNGCPRISLWLCPRHTELCLPTGPCGCPARSRQLGTQATWDTLRGRESSCVPDHPHPGAAQTPCHRCEEMETSGHRWQRGLAAKREPVAIKRHRAGKCAVGGIERAAKADRRKRTKPSGRSLKWGYRDGDPGRRVGVVPSSDRCDPPWNHFPHGQECKQPQTALPRPGQSLGTRATGEAHKATVS